MTERLPRGSNDHACDVEQCTRKAVIRGLCDAHRSRLKRLGDVRADIPIKPNPSY